jgi:Bacteriocin-protection, YdeI or OmpD-Associated
VTAALRRAEGDTVPVQRSGDVERELGRGEGRKGGQAAATFDQASQRAERPGAHSFASRTVDLSAPFAERLRADTRAWRYFAQQPPRYQRTASFWVMSAKREETRENLFGVLLSCSSAGEAIPPLRRPAAESASRRPRA